MKSAMFTHRKIEEVSLLPCTIVKQCHSPKHTPIVLYHCFLYPATVCIIKYGAVQKSCLKNLLLTLFHHVLVHNISLLYHLHSIELLIFVSPSSQKYFPEKQLFITYYYSHNILINTLNYYPVMSGKIAKFHVLIT